MKIRNLAIHVLQQLQALDIDKPKVTAVGKVEHTLAVGDDGKSTAAAAIGHQAYMVPFQVLPMAVEWGFLNNSGYRFQI